MIKDNQSNTEEQILNDNMDDISNPNTEQNVNITILLSLKITASSLRRCVCIDVRSKTAPTEREIKRTAQEEE